MPRRGLILQTRTHWLLLGLALLCSLVLFLYLLECAPQTDGNAPLPGVIGENYGKEYYQALLQEQEEHYQTRATSLKRQIAQLKQELQEMSEKMRSLQERKNVGANGIGYQGNKEQTPSDLLEFLHSQIDKAEVSIGAKLPSEYGVIPFESFTLMKVFQLEMGLTRHPEEKPVRKDKRDELVEVIEAGLEVINNPDEDDEQEEEDSPLGEKMTFNENDFIEGYYRTERDKGTQYELFFKKADLMEYRHVTLFRPFGPLMKVKSEMIDITRSIINIIVPLAERTEAFAQFMQNFRDVCIHQDKRIHLTVVYFGKEGLSKVKSILESVTSESNFHNYTLIPLNEEFNRGQGLNVGAQAWDKGEVLMFFCDVDIYFSAEFLNSCRLNAEPGSQKGFWLLARFWLWNDLSVSIRFPDHCSDFHPTLPTATLPQYWFPWRFLLDEMTSKLCLCWTRNWKSPIYGGFDMEVKGWGGEDVHLYRKYLHGDLIVIRTPVPGLFHLWHEKRCADELTPEQYRMCIQSKAMNEASHSHLGMLVFREEIETHLHKQAYRTNSEAVG
ncbi:chondroitin sulfate N-acetylgalactosaminyltransferase 2 isoform X1 [Acinonyx jubatus]|uniref:Hexosyltransferase n=1 Tax=Acinonyx jubatus TaxID=32536 RepID=A0A6J1ZLL8_ACIJB|nr:chondroitin sulfate N-acetylgalactosaminyltransferase 2 isoform X1 [Acinonyx jubatus]